MSAPKPLTLEELHAAVTGTAAAVRCVARLQPGGDFGDKVFPPTYAGGVYATEERRIRRDDGTEAVVRCVLLDSVQSQANRMEDALLDAYEDGRLRFPLPAVDFAKTQKGGEQADREVARIGRLTALEAPHRIADAIFRDSVTADGKPFRDSPEGLAFQDADIRHATALFGLCPTALVFGMWDSTGSRGGLGNKFARAMVSEIVGVDAAVGVRTSSRLDPLGIQKCELYEHKDGGWTVNEEEAVKEKGKPKPFAAGKDKGKPSAINHGNVTPDIARGDDKEPKGGGVTIAYARQTSVLSLPQLRRLRFPDEKGNRSAERDAAARTALAALAVTAVALVRERGCDLRSRCLLVADGDPAFELVANNGRALPFALSSVEAAGIFRAAVEQAKQAGLPWREEPFVLRPSDRLVELVRKGREAAAKSGGGEDA